MNFTLIERSTPLPLDIIVELLGGWVLVSDRSSDYPSLESTGTLHHWQGCQAHNRHAEWRHATLVEMADAKALCLNCRRALRARAS